MSWTVARRPLTHANPILYSVWFCIPLINFLKYHIVMINVSGESRYCKERLAAMTLFQSNSSALNMCITGMSANEIIIESIKRLSTYLHCCINDLTLFLVMSTSQYLCIRPLFTTYQLYSFINMSGMWLSCISSVLEINQAIGNPENRWVKGVVLMKVVVRSWNGER